MQAGQWAEGADVRGARRDSRTGPGAATMPASRSQEEKSRDSVQHVSAASCGYEAWPDKVHDDQNLVECRMRGVRKTGHP
jgi:hypothetical protein